MIPLAEAIERKTRHIKSSLKVAVMGCAVNGPGEAAAADVGIAGGDGQALLIKKGKIVKRVKEADMLEELKAEINKVIEDRRNGIVDEISSTSALSTWVRPK